MGFHKILVAFDGSEDSVKALKQAIHMKADQQGELCIVTVVKEHGGEPVFTEPFAPTHMAVTGIGTNPVPAAPPPDVGSDKVETLRKYHEREIQEEGEKILAVARATLNANHVQASMKVLQGEPAKAICSHAAVNGFDLIVIGNRGLSGLKKMMMGSVSEKVVQHAECPVLIVK